MTTPPTDGMPTTRGTNFYLADPNLAFVCASVMGSDDFERRRITAWPDLAPADRELDARPVADTLYHAEAAEIPPPRELSEPRPV